MKTCHGGTIGTTINHLVEGFVKGAAVELPRGLRINCISPTVLAESVAYHALFCRLHSSARVGSRPGLSPRDVNANPRAVTGPAKTASPLRSGPDYTQVFVARWLLAELVWARIARSTAMAAAA